jgi:membrane protein
MRIVGAVRRKARAVARAVERTINRVPVPLAQRLGLWDFFRETFKRVGDNNVGAFAGNLAYSGLFGLFPLLLFVLSLLGLFHATGLVNTLIDQAAHGLPGEMIRLLRQANDSITKNNATGAFTVGAIVSILAALWGAKGAMQAVMQGLNVMYGVRDTRPFWKQWLVATTLSVVVAALVLSSLVLVIFGPQIGSGVADHAGLGAEFRWFWYTVQWPIVVAAVLLAFALIYRYAPNVRQTFRLLAPGTLTAVILWLVFSLLFSLFVNNFGSYNKTYGTLAGVIVFLLYAYYSSFILLLGGVMNRVIEAHAAASRDSD